MMDLSGLTKKVEGLSPDQALDLFAREFPGKIVFSTSFGWEDQVITHMIFKNDLPIRVFTLDTGRMFNETYHVWNRTVDRYKKPIEVFSPQAEAVEKLMTEKGPYSFYESIENRKECCAIRKVEPLNRALRGQECWITGIRADQSANRTTMANPEWDEGHQLVKFHPLFSWSLDEVKEYVRRYNIPYNPLHDKGFPSIGCQPCTRAVLEGEDFRAGRWWWEHASRKECGLHV